MLLRLYRLLQQGISFRLNKGNAVLLAYYVIFTCLTFSLVCYSFTTSAFRLGEADEADFFLRKSRVGSGIFGGLASISPR